MKNLNWQQSDALFVAQMHHGTVIISPNTADTSHLNRVRIETPTGQLIAEEVFDFETCVEWAMANLPLMDQVSGRLRDCGNVLETLQNCQLLLSPVTDSAHWLRIEYIKQWISQVNGQIYWIGSIPQNLYLAHDLNWIEESRTLFYVETLYGRAIIEEIHEKGVISGIRHKAKIIHGSGAILDCGSYVDFLEAENALKTNLIQLNSPHLREDYLSHLDFTLAICDHILPENSDPIHYARLDLLAMNIHFAFD